MKTRTPDRKWGYLLFCAKRRIIDSPLLQPRNKGLSCRVRFHHPNLLFVSFSRRVQRPLCCTRTPTAVKGNAFARFRTTACRLRSHRTLSASGRFSTSDSPPSIPLNLYSKGAAPREGLLLSSGSGYSIAARFLFVNDLINKNRTKRSAKTPNFHCLVPTPLPCGALANPLRGAQKENRRACPSAHSGSSFGSAVARSGALTAEDPVVEVLAHVFSPPGRFAYGHCMRTGAKKCTNRRRGNRKNLKPSADCAIIYAYFPQPEPVSAGNTIFKG